MKYASILCALIFAVGADAQQASSITSAQFQNAVTSNGFPAPTAQQYSGYMAGLSKGQITTTQEAAMALAQFLHESGGLQDKRELACVNTGCPGSYQQSDCDAPGQYYYGRGYIQLSWCDWNYKPASQALYGDDRLVQNPDLVASDDQVSWDTSFWYWSVNVHNAPGVQAGQFGATTKAINSPVECTGQNVAQSQQRYQYYVNVRAAFGLAGPGDASGCY